MGAPEVNYDAGLVILTCNSMFELYTLFLRGDVTVIERGVKSGPPFIAGPICAKALFVSNVSAIINNKSTEMSVSANAVLFIGTNQ